MSESLSKNRVQFNTGFQKKFIESAEDKLCLSSTELANSLGISRRTLFDWKKEKFLMSHAAYLELKKKSGCLDEGFVGIKSAYWSTSKAGLVGGPARYAKYGNVGGDVKLREKAWRKWWKKEGKFKNIEILKRKEVILPKYSAELAEFYGIMMGDGCINKNQIMVTLDNRKEKAYARFVSELMEKLFGIKPDVVQRKTSCSTDIVLRSRNVVDYCESLGLIIGNKKGKKLSIPKWVTSNPVFAISCVRGLFDTDGCVFTHSYVVKDKKYSYTKLAFTSVSGSLLRSVQKILINLGFGVRISSDGNDIRIDCAKDVQKFLKIIGTHNPRYVENQ